MNSISRSKNKINKKLLDSYYFGTDFYETDSDNN